MVQVLKAIRPPRAWLAVGLCAGVAVVHADPNPYYLGGSVGLNGVTNVYRQSAFNGNSDTVTTATLLAGVDQLIGRQHLTIDSSLQDNRYKINTPLNNHGYSLKANLDWDTIDRLSGSLTANTSSSLASYNVGESNVQQVFVKNIEKDDMLQALVRVGLVTRYSLETSVTHTSQTFSAWQYEALNYYQNTGSLGLVYKPHDYLRLGLNVRHSTGEYPTYPVAYSTGFSVVGVDADDTYKRDDLDFTSYWNPTGTSKLETRLSWTDNRHDIATLLNYKGLTGLLTWTWQPGQRWSASTSLSRDTGNQIAIGGANLSRVGTSLQLNSSYELTGKIVLNAGLAFRRSGGDSGGPAQYFDDDHSYNVSANWNFSRSLNFSCQYNRTGRNSSTAIYSYSASGYGCTVQGLMY